LPTDAFLRRAFGDGEERVGSSGTFGSLREGETDDLGNPHGEGWPSMRLPLRCRRRPSRKTPSDYNSGVPNRFAEDGTGLGFHSTAKSMAHTTARDIPDDMVADSGKPGGTTFEIFERGLAPAEKKR